jgi:hypothetical protein
MILVLKVGQEASPFMELTGFKDIIHWIFTAIFVSYSYQVGNFP